jgi:hypothetical protein
MRFAAIFLLVLLFFSFAPVHALEINPSVDNQPIYCKFTFTKWICTNGGNGGNGIQGPQGLPGTGNISNFFNLSMMNITTISNITSFFNTSGNITASGTTINFINITQSEMNQTVNMTAGPQGPPGSNGTNGIDGINNMTANMTAGPQGIQGVNGTPGLQGDKGEKGDQGIQGIQGVNGTPGATGPQGIQGDQGPIGLPNMTAGPQGVNGTPGATGPQGIQGIQGNPGTNGLNNMTMNQTANMTAGLANMTMNQTMLDETAYYWKNTTRALTGTLIKRDVITSSLGFFGGTDDWHGASLITYGELSSFLPGGFYISTLTAGGNSTGPQEVLRITGMTNTPMYILGKLPASAQSSAVCFNSVSKELTYNAGVTTCTASTEKVKKNIKNVTANVTTRLMQLQAVNYTLDIDNETHYGLLAENVTKVFPELAAHSNGNLTGVRYEEFTAILLKGFQEQKLRLDRMCNKHPNWCDD